jgi:hypothetical protein
MPYFGPKSPVEKSYILYLEIFAINSAGKYIQLKALCRPRNGVKTIYRKSVTKFS